MSGGRFHKIRGLRVSGGFLDGLDVQFDPRLNCIIGGRGSGKTTVLEFLRFALKAMPDADRSSGQRKQILKLLQGNMQTGRITVEVETKDGLVYFVERSPALLDYPGATPFTARLRAIEWEDWTGGPIIRFTLTFEGETDNPLAAGVTITPVAGPEPPKTFEPIPAATDAFRSAVDEAPSATKDKTISLSGVLRGTLAEVTAE
jgi:hypothetical protein